MQTTEVNSKKVKDINNDFILFMDIINHTSKSVEAYQTLFNNHKKFIYNQIRLYHPSLISNIDLNTKEIFNLSIVKVQKKILSKKYKYDGRATFRTYIFEVYKYVAKEIMKEFRKRKFDLLDDNKSYLSISIDSTYTPCIDAFIDSIYKIGNNIHRKVLVEIFLDGSTTQSIAEKFGTTPSNVRQIKRRNLTFLRKEIQKHIS